jgi:hypothetical protein
MLHCFSRLGPFYLIGRTDYNEMVQHIMKTTTTTRDQTTPADENANNHIDLEKTIDSITEGASSILSLLSKSLPMPALKMLKCYVNLYYLSVWNRTLSKEQF